MKRHRLYSLLPLFVVTTLALSVILSYRTLSKRATSHTNFYNHLLWYCHKYGMPIYESDSINNRIIISINIFDTIGELIIDLNPADSNLAIRCPFPGLLIPEEIPTLAVKMMQKNGEYNSGAFEIDTTLRLLVFRKTIDARSVNIWDSTLFYNISDAAFQLDRAIPIIMKEMNYKADSLNCSFQDET